jgi:hypothetical protein
MAKKPPPLQAPVVDLRREMATLKATSAPVIYFDSIPTSGVYGGVANMTVDCGLHIVWDGVNINEPRTVAHLRFPLALIPSIRAALDHVENILKPVPEKLKN